MVVIYYSTDNEISGINKELAPPNNDDTLYDFTRDGGTVFVKDIIFKKQDSDKEVCVQTFFDQRECFDKTTNSLKLDQIKNITLKRKENIPELPVDFIPPPYNMTPPGSTASPQTVIFPPAQYTSLDSYDLISNFIPIDNSLPQDIEQLNSHSYSQYYGDINTGTTLPLNTGPEPEPNNDDKSKDETSLWMFLTNNLWLLIIIGIVIIISVYTYMTFQERTEAYTTSIFGNGN